MNFKGSFRLLRGYRRRNMSSATERTDTFRSEFEFEKIQETIQY